MQQGLARSRGHARELIRSGSVLVGGKTVTKAAHPVRDPAGVRMRTDPEVWVSRAAHKLRSALEEFGAQGLQVRGRRCLDVGASTGGFTQVLLAHEAATVLALDVGHGQLAAELAADARVEERAGTNVRRVTAADLGGPADLVVVDISFISLQVVMTVLAELTDVDGDLVVLIKPQFEVGRQRLGKGGLVRRTEDRRRAILETIDQARRHGLAPHGLRASPITGTGGNAEYLLWLRHGGAVPGGGARDRTSDGASDGTSGGIIRAGMMSETETLAAVGAVTQKGEP